jgi:heavy metal sensor kinase
LIRSGAFSEGTQPAYYVALGRQQSLNEAIVRRFTVRYFATLPVIVFVGGLLGWFLTKRAMQPLQDVVRTSESITGANLHLRIPSRGAGDELDRLIDTFNQMVGRLENSFQQMRQFTADVSHELRTPITAVRGQLEVALMSARREEELREAIQAALEETERLSNLVRAMLALSHAESGQTILRRQRLDLAVLASNILEHFRILADEAGIRLVTVLPPGCEAEVDPTQFVRLVSNLLSNAIKYTSSGGEVRLSFASGPASVEVAVEDTGRGISSQHLPHIFDRFYRVPGADAGSERGLGLGLSFVAWIVSAHGGKIEVTSQPGSGSSFVVSLPRAAAKPTGFV